MTFKCGFCFNVNRVNITPNATLTKLYYSPTPQSDVPLTARSQSGLSPLQTPPLLSTSCPYPERVHKPASPPEPLLSGAEKQRWKVPESEQSLMSAFAPFSKHRELHSTHAPDPPAPAMQRPHNAADSGIAQTATQPANTKAHDAQHSTHV